MRNKKLSVISFILALMMCIMCAPGAMAADGAPVVAKMTPADGAKNVQTAGTVFQFVFTEELDQKAVESAGSISINNGARVLATKLVNPNTVNVYIADLLPNADYTIKITPMVRSIQGVAAEAVEKKFSTGAAPLNHQVVASDMSDLIWRLAYTDAGANAIQFVKEGDNDVLQIKMGWADAPVVHSVAVEAGVTYKCRAMVKSDQAQAMRVVMSYDLEGDDEWYRVGEKWDQQVPAGEWVEIDSTFTIPDDLNTASIPNLRITGRIKGSVIMMDDIQFYEANTDEPVTVMDPGGATSNKMVTTIEEPTADLTTQKLEALGVYSKGDYAEKMTVTREVFSTYMANILNLQNVKSTANFENYTDVNVGYDGHIGTMVEMNILTANDKGELRPNDAITFSEACRAFVVALGHQKTLEQKTPIVAASNLGIRNLTALKAADEVTYADLNGLLDSFLKAECLYNEFGDFRTGEVLKAKLGITKLKGIVEATSQTSLDNAQGINDGYVKISGKTYKLIDTDVTDVLGKNVTYYIKEIDGENCVLFLGDIEKNNKTLKLDAYDVNQYANNTYTYLSDDQVSGKRAELESDKIVIYNGITTTNYQATDMTPTYGWVELIDNDKNGKYDVVKITKYDTYVVESYDSATEIIRDKFETKSISLGDADEVLVYKKGKSSKLNAIKNDDILTIERSMDGKRIVIHISSDVIEGDIGEVKTDDIRGTKFVSFYDVVHGQQVQKLVPCVKGYDGIANTPIGDGGMFYIDTFGQIAAFVKGTGSWTYGYIKKARLWDDEFVRIEMFTQNNTHEILECAEKVNIDSYKTTDQYDTFDVLANSGSDDADTTFVEPELIMYKTNKEGLIKQIKTARNASVNDDFRKIKDIVEGRYFTATNMITTKYIGETFKGETYVGEDTLVLKVPADANVSDTYQYSFMNARSSLLNNKNTNFTVYSLSENVLKADLLVVKDKLVWNQDARSQGIVTGIKNKLNDDGEAITVVTTTAGTLQLNDLSVAKVDNMTASDGTTGLVLKNGDYVGWRNRGDGYIHDMSIIFKAESKTNMQSSATSGAAIDMVKCLWGTVNRKEGAIVEIVDADGNKGLYNAEKTTIYRVIGELGTVEKVTINELSKEAATQVAVFHDWDGKIACMVLYK